MNDSVVLHAASSYMVDVPPPELVIFSGDVLMLELAFFMLHVVI
jgi:hypothetical protein